MGRKRNRAPDLHNPTTHNSELAVGSEPRSPQLPHPKSMRAQRLTGWLTCLSAIIALGCQTASPAQAQTPEAGALLIRFPDVSAGEIVFRYDGDLWLVDRTGGLARRLTSAPGSESLPKFDPSGTRIAFTADYDGGRDLYVLPTSGGIPERVTYHAGGETLSGWTPDGKSLIFHSNALSGQARAPQVFHAGIDGAQPEAYAIPYGAFACIDPTGTWMAYTPSSREFRTWKRYRGGLAQDIWLYNLNTQETRRVTSDPGTDQLPMWHGDDLYFLSDRGDAGVANLYRYDLESQKVQAVTDFQQSGVRFPSIGPKDIVFEWSGALWRFEIESGNSVRVPIEMPTDRPALRPVFRKLAGNVANVDLSPNAKGVLIEARGELFRLAAEEGLAQNMTRSSGSAERFPAWSPDGSQIAFWSDRSGEYELYLMNSDGSAMEGEGSVAETDWRQLTHMGAGWKYQANWSPDGKTIAFGTYDGHLYSLDVESATLNAMVRASNVGEVNMDFSPDSRWLTWEMGHSDTHSPAIFLYDLDNKAIHQVTSGMFADTRPTFDVNGDWLYFLSSRTFSPSYADVDSTWIYENTRNIMAVALRTDVESPFAPVTPPESWGPTEEVEGEAEEGEDSEDESEQTEVEESEVEESKDILLDGFEARAQQLTVKHNNVMAVIGMDGGVAYLVRPSGPGASGFDVHLLKMERDAEAKLIIDGIDRLTITPNRKNLLVRKGQKWAVIAAGPGQKIEDNLDLAAIAGSFEPRAEWDQMLLETYRLYRDFFYDENMHGVDWRGVYERYAASLKQATHREDLHYLIGEMIGELNVGHAYNRASADVNRAGTPSPGVGLLGCDFVLEQGAYRIGRILGTPYDTDSRSPLNAPGVDVQEGDFVLQVDGVAIDANLSIYKAFIGKAGKTVRLTVNKAPVLDGEERIVSVVPAGSERGLRYRTWVHDNREAVRKASNGRIGYVHVPDTGQRGQNELMRQFIGQRHHDALIIDERWNGGGQIPWRFVELLDRPTLNYWATRGTKAWDFPGMRHAGPKCMLINGAAGSGGDCFPYYFRQKGLGKIIGTRTWGGLVGISGNPSLIDGGNTSIPTFGFYELDGTWGIENYGVDPDIEVLDDPAKMLNGGDPQLEAGVAHLLEELRKHPKSEPRRPAGPNRSRAGAGILKDEQ